MDSFGHMLSWASVAFLVKELLDLPLLRSIFHPHGSLERSQQVFHTRIHSLTVSLSAPVERRIWSSSVV